jgi:hypothetical protein
MKPRIGSDAYIVGEGVRRETKMASFGRSSETALRCFDVCVFVCSDLCIKYIDRLCQTTSRSWSPKIYSSVKTARYPYPRRVPWSSRARNTTGLLGEY